MLLTLDDFLTVIRRKTSLTKEEKREVEEFLEVHDNTAQFLEAIEEGLNLPFLATNYLPRDGTFKRLVTIRWGVSNEFENDDDFTNTRFQVATMHWNSGQPVHKKLWSVAGQQYIRMLQAGRVDMRYMTLYIHMIMTNYRDPELTAWSAAHNEDTLRELLDDFDRAKRSPHLYIKDQAVYLQGVLAEARRIRREVFLKRWLPTAISAEEYANAQDIDLTLLTELYPQVWEGGYNSWRKTR